MNIFGNLDTAETQVLAIDMGRISPDPDQPRKIFADAEIDDLAASIEEHGLLSPIIVRMSENERGKYVIVAGERRWRAHDKLNRPSIDAIVRSAENAPAVSIIENMQRVDLNPLEAADAVARLMELESLNQTQVAKLLGKKRLTIQQLLTLGSLPDEIRKDPIAADLSKSILIEIAAIEDGALQMEMWGRVQNGGLTVAAIRDAKQEAAPTQRTAKKKVSGGRLTPVEAALLKISGGIATLQGKDLSDSDRRQVQELVTQMSDIASSQ